MKLIKFLEGYGWDGMRCMERYQFQEDIKSFEIF